MEVIIHHKELTTAIRYKSKNPKLEEFKNKVIGCIKLIKYYDIHLTNKSIPFLFDILDKNKIIESINLSTELYRKNMSYSYGDLYYQISTRISKFIENNNTLTYLNLTCNTISTNVSIIVKAILKVDILQCLILKNTFLIADSYLSIIKLIEETTSLKYLDVSDSSIASNKISLILNSLDSNQTIETLLIQDNNYCKKPIFLDTLNSQLECLNIKNLNVDLKSITNCIKTSNLESFSFTLYELNKGHLSEFVKSLKNKIKFTLIINTDYYLDNEDLNLLSLLIVNTKSLTELKLSNINNEVMLKTNFRNKMLKYFLNACRINQSLRVFDGIKLKLNQINIKPFKYNKINPSSWLRKENVRVFLKR